VVVLVVALLAFGYVFSLNPGLTEFKIVPGKEPIRTSFALILFLFFLAGIGMAVFGAAFQGALRSFAFWRFARRSQRKDEARQLVVEGRSSAALGKTAAARRLLQRAQRKAPGESYVALETARMELADGRVEQAERRLKGLLKEAPHNSEVLSLLLDVYRRRGNFENQVATLTRWLEVDPGHLAALRSLRELYTGVGNWAEAVRVQGRILAKVNARTERAAERRQLSLFRYREAATLPPARAKGLLEQVVREDETFAPAHASLGDALLALGDREAGLQAWTRGYQASGQAGLLLKAEAVRARDGQDEEMLKLYRKLGKKGGAPLLLRARLLVQLGRNPEALKLLEDDVQGAGGTRTGRLLAGEARRRMGEFDGAAKAFHEALCGADGELPVAFVCDQCHAGVSEWAATCARCEAVGSLVLDTGALAPRAG
jgi:tetratricopeptide (TPR) repeat protein